MVGSDRNLLFGILAVQMDFITSAQLIDAAGRWLLNKKQSLGTLLVEGGMLGRADCDTLESLVDRHIARSGSVEESIKRLQGSNVTQELSKVTDFVTQLDSGKPSSLADVSGTLSWTQESTQAGNRFNLLRELARGGLGEVFVARDQELDREVALKKILNTQSTLEVRQRFVAEAKITGSLEHPGVVPVYGLGTFTDGQPFYAMRLIRGHSLHESIEKLQDSAKKSRSNPLDDREFRHLVRSVIEACYAVGYAHSRGVLHRDIKPHNIMLGKYGETLVVDWGLAKVTGVADERLAVSEIPVEDSRSSESGPTQLGTVLGTPGYMSPEQAFGRLDILDRRSDVFSLGATLYAVLTGQTPYRGKARHEVLRAAQECNFEPPRTLNPKLPKSLEAICLKAMARAPEDRYDSALGLADDLDAWIAGAPVVAYPESWPLRLFRFARRHQTAVASLLVFLLVSAGGLLIANRAIRYQRDQAHIERDKAFAAEEIARQERDKADAANKIATYNSQVSIEILDQFVKTIADDRWSQVPALEKERTKMVDLGLERFTQLLAQSPNNNDIKKQVCQMLIRSAHIYQLSGNKEVALDRIDKAKEFAGQLATLFDSDPRLLGLYSDALVYASVIHESQSSLTKALEEASLAVSVSRSRVKMKSDSLSQLGLALALSRRGELNRAVSQNEAAIADLKDAIDSIGQSQSKFKTLVMANAQLSLAEVQVIGAPEQASRTANAALETIAPALAKNAEATDMLNIRASVLKTLAIAHMLEKQSDKAKQHIEEALSLFEKLASESAENQNFRLLLLDAKNVQAELALRQSEHEVCRQMTRDLLSAINSLEDGREKTELRLISLAIAQACSLQQAEPAEAPELKTQLQNCYSQLREQNTNNPVLPRADAILALGN